MDSSSQASIKLLERVKKNLRPTLISQKGGVSLERLNRDYSELMGEGIPFRQLQFQSMETFLRSIPDICSVEWRKGEVMVSGVADENTEHIVKMVRLQKTKSRTRKKRGGGPSRPTQRQPLTRGGGRSHYLGRVAARAHVGGRHYDNMGGYQMSRLQITVGVDNRSVSVRSGGNRVGVLPSRASSCHGPQVMKKSHVNIDSVQDGMKDLTARVKVYEQTVGGDAVFGPRVGQVLEGRVYGLFSSQVEKMYEKKWEKMLPSDWCHRLATSGVLRIEKQNGQMLVFWGSDIGENLQQHSSKNAYNQPSPAFSLPPPPFSQYPYPPPQTICYKTPERLASRENLPLACSSLTEIHSTRQMYRQPPRFLPSPRAHPTQEGHANDQVLTSLPPLSFPRGSNWDISVCLVTASNKIYFQFNDNMERLEEMVTSMDDFFTTNSLPLARSEMCPELVCCANVEGGFYRVKILDIQDEGICICFFLDIGLENQVDCDDLQELPPLFQQLPGQAVPACLAKVEHEEEKDVLEFVTKILDGESFVALVDNREELGDFYIKDQEAPFLFLMDSNCCNMAVEINKFIVQSSSRSFVNDSNNNKSQGLLLSSSDLYPGVASSKSHSKSLCTPITNSNNSSLLPEVSSSFLSSPDNSSPTMQSHSGPLPSTPLPPLSSLYDLTVVHTTSPDQFQIVSYSQKVAYAALLSQMTGYYKDLSNHTPVTDDHLRVGSILAFRDSSAWQRAKVVRVVNLHPLAVALKLVDQGCFKACTSPDDLQPLGERFAQLPPQAVAARLCDMQVGVGGWGEEVLDWFREVTVGRDFVARVKDIVKNVSLDVVLVIDLIDTSKPEIDVNINKEVMARQLVWRSRVGL